MNIRWKIKKAARYTVIWGSEATRPIRAGLSGRSSTSIRALTYHRFGERIQDPFTVSESTFDRQMQVLHEQRRAISLDDLEAFVSDARAVPADACLVTIDDGMISTLTQALPILERWHVPAVAYVCSGLVGRRIPDARERYMDWSELRQLASSTLIDISSHAHTHRSLGQMTSTDAREEIQRSKLELEDKLGVEVRSFAYPFGTKTDFNAQTEGTLRHSGYSTAFHSLHGSIHTGANPLSLPRAKVEGGESVALFEMISRGAMDAWRLVDDHLWKLQRRRTEVQ